MTVGTSRTMKAASPPAPLQRARGVETQEAVIPAAETATASWTKIKEFAREGNSLN